MTGNPTISQAMVLGAGMGSRMRDLTADRPKPMVEVAGQPLIDHVLNRLEKAGVTQSVVNVHYKAEVLETHLGSRTAPPKITISDERGELLDTGGGVVKALDHFGDEAFYIHNSDSIWHEPHGAALAALHAAWDEKKMDTLLLLANPRTTLGYDGRGDFCLADDGRLTRKKNDETQAYVFTGVSIATRRLFNEAPSGAFSLNVLWDRAIASGRLYGMMLDGQWMHVGTPEAVEQANATYAATEQGARAK